MNEVKVIEIKKSVFAENEKRHINPYKEDVFINQKYYKDAMERADLS